MIGYRYNKKKNVVIAYFCNDIHPTSMKGKDYWQDGISNSLWKVFSQTDLICLRNWAYDGIVEKAVSSVKTVAVAKVTDDCDIELAKKIAKDRLNLKWARLEKRILGELIVKINSWMSVVNDRSSKKLEKCNLKIARLSNHSE